MRKKSPRPYVPPQREPGWSAEKYCAVLQDRMDHMTKQMESETRDRKTVLRNRIAVCHRLMAKTIEGKR